MINFFIFLIFNFSFSFGLQCAQNYFSLPGMTYCHSILNCSDIEFINALNLAGEGSVKFVFKGLWNNHIVAVNKLKDYVEDFQSGLAVLKLLSPNPFTVQLIGYCDAENIFITEFHSLGDGRNLLNILKSESADNIYRRLSVCINYVEILEFIHSDNNGVRVMCDSNGLMKTLSQYLINDNLRLILNDVDALPSAEKAKIKCGHREITGDFVAPEQLWPFPKMVFNDSMMPSYDQMTDIWKIPDVCEYFLSDVRRSNEVKHQLLEIHKQCKNRNPNERPTASEIKKIYQKIFYEITTHLEL